MVLGRSAVVYVWCGLLAGCVRSNTHHCANGNTCPADKRCDDSHGLCVTPDQLAECRGRPDGEPCLAGMVTGFCDREVCIQGCGNGAIEDLALLGLGSTETCDDGNRVDGDGCSGSCTDEELAWQPWRSVWGPVLSQAITFDSARARIVMFGGAQLDVPLGDHWERGVAGEWVRVSPAAQHPAARIDAMMAFDSVRGVTVLFGGTDALGQRLADTWELSAAGWREIAPTQSPPARASAAMAFDPVRARVVMHGGSATADLGDTWEYDGTTWTSIAASPGPGPRNYHQMVWNASHQRIVLFGGHSSTPLGDTWAYANGAWSLVASGGPASRYGHQLAYSTTRDRVVLFSGITSAGFASDTWELDDSTWTLMNPAPIIPPARAFGGAVGIGDSIVIVGGRDPAAALNDVYEYDADGTWRPRPPAFAPPPRETGQMVYDSTLHRAVVFGGLSGSPLDDTWVFDGAWTRAADNMPLRRYASAAGYDPIRKRVVAFGGVGPGSVQGGETLEWDPIAQLWSTGPSRAAQRGGAMAFDASLGKLVLFGGSIGDTVTAATATDQVWEYDGAWTERAASPRPPAMGSPAMAYDEDQQRLVVFTQGETWQRVAGAWTKLEPLAAPPPRGRPAMVFHPTRRKIWLYGGNLGNTIFDDVWELSPDGSTWTEVVVRGTTPQPRRTPSLVGDLATNSLVLYGGAAADAVLGDTWFLDYR